MKENEYLHMYLEEENHWWYSGMRGIVRSLFPKFSTGEAPRVLDAGCGTGYFMGWFRSQYAGRMTGADYHPRGLSFCRRRGERDLVQADITDLPFAGGVFDLVTSFDVISQVPEERSRCSALRELLRVLKPGGRLVARVPAYEWLRSSHDDAVMTYRRYCRQEMRAALIGAGFQPERLTYANAVLFPLAACWRLLKKAGLTAAGSDVCPGTRGNVLMNRILLACLGLEARLLRRRGFSFGFGLSLFVVARKPPR